MTRVVREHRRALQAQERAALAVQRVALARAVDALAREAELLLRQIASYPEPERADLVRLAGVRRMLVQAEAELEAVGRATGQAIGAQRAKAAQLARRSAAALLDAAMGEPPPGLPNASAFMVFPREGLETMAGTLAAGPVAETLGRYGAAAAAEAGRVLTEAIATGAHPRAVRAALARALDVYSWQAARLARTEIYRANRESLRGVLAANRAITPKWRWRSARLPSTCAACWALDSRLFDVDEPMGTHPGCRCTLQPEPISWAELARRHGVAMPPGDWEIPPEPTGPEAFAALPASDQLAVLGPAKYAAYREGEIRLTDLVHASTSDDWGVTRREGSLAHALTRAGRRKAS